MSSHHNERHNAMTAKKYQRYSDAARAFERALREAGGRRMTLLLSPEGNEALKALMKAKKKNAGAVIAEALIFAATSIREYL